MSFFLLVQRSGPQVELLYGVDVVHCTYGRFLPVFRIRIQVDPDSNCQSRSRFGLRIRILQLKLSFFKTVEGCTNTVEPVNTYLLWGL